MRTKVRRVVDRDKVHSVVGYICPQGRIVSHVVYWEDSNMLHSEVFPSVQFMRKRWRYDPDFDSLNDFGSPLDLTEQDRIEVESHLRRTLGWKTLNQE